MHLRIFENWGKLVEKKKSARELLKVIFKVERGGLKRGGQKKSGSWVESWVTLCVAIDRLGNRGMLRLLKWRVENGVVKRQSGSKRELEMKKNERKIRREGCFVNRAFCHKLMGVRLILSRESTSLTAAAL